MIKRCVAKQRILNEVGYKTDRECSLWKEGRVFTAVRQTEGCWALLLMRDNWTYSAQLIYNVMSAGLSGGVDPGAGAAQSRPAAWPLTAIYFDTSIITQTHRERISAIINSCILPRGSIYWYDQSWQLQCFSKRWFDLFSFQNRTNHVNQRGFWF